MIYYRRIDKIPPCDVDDCGHEAGLGLQDGLTMQVTNLCGCCFVDLIGHGIAIQFSGFIDLRTGMIIPFGAARERARHLN